jgi:hypothetical protein
MSDRSRRFRRRRYARGFSHMSMVVESAAVMGWFVILVLGEKYMDDATRSRRSTEDATQQSSMGSAMGFCRGSAEGGPTHKNEIGGFRLPSSPNAAMASTASVNISMLGTGKPQLSPSIVPTLIAGLGLVSLKTLPNYFLPFQAADAVSIAGSVKAAEPLGFTSGTFRGQHTAACLERSLDLPGAPWVNLKIAREGIFITNIMGY